MCKISDALFWWHIFFSIGVCHDLPTVKNNKNTTLKETFPERRKNGSSEQIRNGYNLISPENACTAKPGIYVTTCMFFAVDVNQDV